MAISAAGPPSMPEPRLIIVDPGHFHAALVQKEMYANLSAEAHVYAPLGPDLVDYLGRIARCNGPKLERIAAAVEAGLHVIADKPAIIRREDLPRLAAVLDLAEERRLVVCDLMTGRQDVITRLIRALRDDPEVFGAPLPGNAA